MKKVRILVSIALCLILCMNLIPVYGSDSAATQPSDLLDNVITGEENTDNDEPTVNEPDDEDIEIEVPDEPEIMPLTPPAAVKTAFVDSKYVKLSWNKVYGATGYKVYRGLSEDGKYKLQKTVNGTSYIDKKVYKGQAFYYKVRAVNAENDELDSELSASAVYCMKPAAPIISAKNNNGDIRVSWKKVSGAEKYYIYIYSKKPGKYIKIGETSKLAFIHKKALNNAFLYYKVKAVYVENGKTVTGNLSKNVKVLSRHVNPNKKMVALTFDDGPSIHTKAIVDCLFKYDSAATFFVVGNRIDSYKDTVKHTYNKGCELANHSYSHPLLTDLSKDSVKTQIRKTDNKIKAITGEKTALVRVPYGGHNEMVRKAVGKPLIQWSDDTMDWKTRSKSATVKYVMNHVSDGDIILMHDIHEPTKKAALELIPKLRAKGYQIVTVSELAKYKGYKLKKGTAYSSFR